MAGRRSTRRFAQVLLWIEIELLFALGPAEVIRLPFVIGVSRRANGFHVHAAHWILHNCCVLHYHFSFVRLEEPRPALVGWRSDHILPLQGRGHPLTDSSRPASTLSSTLPLGKPGRPQRLTVFRHVTTGSQPLEDDHLPAGQRPVLGSGAFRWAPQAIEKLSAECGMCVIGVQMV